MKPFSSGSPTEASMMNRKNVAYIGIGVAKPAEFGDLVGVAALVENARQHEQRAGRDAVRQHHEHRAVQCPPA